MQVMPVQPLVADIFACGLFPHNLKNRAVYIATGWCMIVLMT